VLVVGQAASIVTAIESSGSGRYSVVGVVDDTPGGFRSGQPPLLGPLSRLSQAVEDCRPDLVLIDRAEHRLRLPLRALVESCVARGIAVEDAGEFRERLAGKVAIESLAPAGIVFGSRFGPSPVQRTLSRVLSLVVATAGLVLFAPLLGLIAIAVKIESAGPVLFRQMRVGAHGRPFRLLKFRTMRTGSARTEWERDNRDRVTRVGRILRAVRLDELPQFVNVLRGEMNLVGPRPHPLSNFELFTLVARNMNDRTGSAVSYYALRTMVRPGMTGWAQVRYRYANDLDEEIEKLRFDLYYVKHVTVALDIRILIETIRVVLYGHRSAADAVSATAPALALPERLNQGHAA
jgi:lipopolysaccharide/colanic/teichoic acid biosynthesis glycosyltransferase